MRLLALLLLLSAPSLAPASIDAPGAVALSPTGQSGQLLFSWAPVTTTAGITAYQIYRATYADLSAVTPFYVTTSADLSSTLPDGLPQWYAVSATPTGSTVSVTISAIPFGPLGAPFLTATAQPYGAGLWLQWTQPATHGYAVGAYQIQQLSGSGVTVLQTVAASMTQTTLSIPCAAAVTIQVQAVDVLGLTGTASNAVAAAYPCAPVLQATGLSSSAMAFAWSAVPGAYSPFAGYELRYASVAGSAQPFSSVDQTVSAPQSSATATALAQGNSRWFRVYGIDGNGLVSPGSNEVAQLAPPLSVTAGASHGKVFLAWARPDASTDFKLTAYQVYYATYGAPVAAAPGTQLLTVADPGSGSFAYATLTSLSDGLPVTVALAAQGGDGIGHQGALGLTLSVTPRLPDPVISSFNQPFGLTITVAWQAVDPSPLTPPVYTVFAANDSSFSALTPLASLTGTSAAFSSLSLPSLQYWFVTVSDSAGNGSNSSPTAQLFAPQLSAPSVTVVESSNSRVKLQWPAVANAGTYQVYRATFGVTGTAAVYSTLASWEIAGTTFVDTHPVDGQANLYQVLARHRLALPVSIQESPLSLSVSASPAVGPGIPGAYATGAYLTASARPTLDAVDLSWAPAAPGSRLISSYRIDRGHSFDSMTFVANVGVTTYSETILNPTGQFYGITAIDLSGNASMQLTGTPLAYSAWPAPQNPSAMALATAVSLSWAPPAGQGSYPFSAYAVYRMDQNGAADLFRGSTTNTAFLDLGASSANGSTLNYGIAVLDSLGLSGTAVRVVSSFSPPAYTGVTPSVPTGINAQVLSGTALNALVQWQPNPQAEQVSSYAVYRSGTLVALTGSTSLVDTGTSLDTAAAYTVFAVNAAGSGATGTASPSSLSIDPPQPGSATALFDADSTGNTTLTQRLQWADLGVPAWLTSYKVYRKAGVFTGVAGATNLGSTTATAFADNSVVPSAYQSYAIVGMIGSSASASPVAQVALTVTAAPVAPTALSATVKSGGVTLLWQGHSQDRQYWIYRSPSALGLYPDISQILTTTTGVKFVDGSADATFIQNYAVAAVNELGRGPATALSVTPLPGAVTALSAKPGYAGSPQIALQWSPPAAPGLATGYEISRATGPSSAFSVLGSQAGTGFTDSGVVVNTPYYYQIRSMNLGFGTANAVTGPVSAYNPPLAPTGLKALGGPTGVDLAWDLPSSAQGVTGYALTVQPWDGLTPAQVLSLPARPAAYSISGLAAAQGVSVTLKAGNSAGASAAALASAQANAAGPAALAMNFSATVGFYEPNTALVHVVLGWTALATGVNALVYRSTAPIPLSLAAGGPASPLYLTGVSGSNGSLTDTAVVFGQTYYYALSAVGPGGLPGAESLATRVDAVAPFAYPNPVALTATAGLSRVDLQWSPAAFGGSYGLGSPPYRLYRFLSTKGAASQFGTAPDSGFPLALSGTSYVDTQIQNGNFYQYFVSVVDSLGHEQQSPAGRLDVRPLGPRAAPASVLAVPGDASVSLRWLSSLGDTLDGLKFDVYRRQGNQDYGAPLPSLTLVGPSTSQEFQGTVSLIVLTLRDTDGLQNKQTYCYSLSQVNDYGEGGKSQEVCVTPYRPLAPSTGNLQIAVSGKKDIQLTWNPQMQTIDLTQSYSMSGFRVYRSLDGGTTYSLLATLGSTAGSYLDNSTGFGGAYVYRVVPVDGAGNEGYSYGLASVVIPSSINAVLVFRNSFNPALNETAPIQYSLLQPGHAWVKVFTQQGEFVATIFDEDVAHATADNPYLSDKKAWDGRNAQGQTVASGVYLIHLEAPGYRANARVAVIK